LGFFRAEEIEILDGDKPPQELVEMMSENKGIQLRRSRSLSNDDDDDATELRPDADADAGTKYHKPLAEIESNDDHTFVKVSFFKKGVK
jgi:hypothetical protein